jgi:hypothetical protein
MAPLGPWLDSTMRLAGAFLSLSHLWRQDLQQDSAVIVIIIHIGNRVHSYHQVFDLAITIHHQQICFNCCAWVLEGTQVAATFAPAAPGLGGKGVGLQLCPNGNKAS